MDASVVIWFTAFRGSGINVRCGSIPYYKYPVVKEVYKQSYPHTYSL